MTDESITEPDVLVCKQVVHLLPALLPEPQRELQLAYLFINDYIALVGRLSHRKAVMYSRGIVETGRHHAKLENTQHPYTCRTNIHSISFNAEHSIEPHER